MGDLFDKMFGRGELREARAEAAKTAQDSREMQAVANNRQLAELNRTSERAKTNRANPRGRRLFTAAAAKANLS